jgi:hypothetical protein
MGSIFGLGALDAAALEDQGIVGQQRRRSSGIATVESSVESIDGRCCHTFRSADLRCSSRLVRREGRRNEARNRQGTSDNQSHERPLN